MAAIYMSFDQALAPFGEPVAPSTGFFTGFFDAIMRSRRISAEREMARHAHLIADITTLSMQAKLSRHELPF